MWSATRLSQFCDALASFHLQSSKARNTNDAFAVRCRRLPPLTKECTSGHSQDRSLQQQKAKDGYKTGQQADKGHEKENVQLRMPSTSAGRRRTMRPSLLRHFTSGIRGSSLRLPLRTDKCVPFGNKMIASRQCGKH